MSYSKDKMFSDLGRLGLDSKKFIVGVDYGTTFTGKLVPFLTVLVEIR
jgi:hypothetical protein